MALGGLAACEALLAAGLAAWSGWTFGEALYAFVPTNATMGMAFALCGAVIAWHRPRNPIGWLFVADGLGHGTSALAAPLAWVLHDAAAPIWLQRTVLTVFGYAWPWSIGLFLPLALLLFPDGRALSPRWRLLIAAVIVTAPLFVVYTGAAPEALLADVPLSGYLTIAAHGALQPLWTLAEVRHVVLVAVAIVALVLRYRRSAETGRRQLLWLLLATIAMLLFTAAWGFVAGTPIVVLFAIPLIPIAVAVAIIRHQLLDIRLVVARAVAWLLASAGAVLVYVALVAVLDTVVSERLGRSAVATVIVALLVAPVLPRLQRLVDRAMYGDRKDPASVVSRIGQQLVTDTRGGLSGVVAAVRDALRVPYAAVTTPDGPLAEDGEPPRGATGSVALDYQGERLGELVVGLRPGERVLADADQDALRLIAVPLAAAVHATRLSDELQASRERIVTAREEERRRLRSDLHDGLGPALTGVALAADAAANLVEDDPARARELLGTLRADTRTAIADVRRLIDDLRPGALDELGLLGALRHHAEQARWRADGQSIDVRLHALDLVHPLPAAVEVAGYRIATEALHNVVRHSRATSATIRIRCGDTLDVEVSDDGAPNGPWRPGVGLRTMRERAAELGGRFEAGPSATGGRVFASLPLERP
ncbi:MAG: two-component sensor histidine kinase [Actinophytocola sp.]|nr:two-component sensor histidine kinase [Actinophytocola sp.]